MAVTYVTGPVHIYVGIEPILALLVQQATQQAELKTGIVPGPQPPEGEMLRRVIGPCSDTGDTVTQIVRTGTLENNMQKPAPQPLIAALLRLGLIPVYLGTALVSPEIEIIRGWLPWYDDEQGTTLPADELYEGEESWVTADLNRFNEGVYAAIASVISRAAIGGGVRGLNFAGDVGTSMVYEGFTYPLLLQFPYSGKPIFAVNGLPPGYRYFNATLAGPDRLAPMGTQVRKTRLVWRCREYLDLDSGAMALYDHSMNGVNGIN